MPQKRMAARGQSTKLAKGPSLKKALPKANGKTKDQAKKAKVPSNLVDVRTPAAKMKMTGKTALKGQAKNAASSKAIAGKTVAPKAGKSASPQAQIETAKAALKTAMPAGAKATAKTTAAAVKEPKAAKESKRGRKISIDISPNEAASALSGKWSTLFKKAEQIEAKPYNMKAVFEEKTAITHKVLGWGYILANRNDRLEVLFKDGIKYLISNYKP